MRALVWRPFQVRQTRTITIPNHSTAHCNTRETHVMTFHDDYDSVPGLCSKGRIAAKLRHFVALAVT